MWVSGASDAICLEHGLSVVNPVSHPSAVPSGEAEKGRKPNFRGAGWVRTYTPSPNAYTMRSFWGELVKWAIKVRRIPQVTHAAVKPQGSARDFSTTWTGEAAEERKYSPVLREPHRRSAAHQRPYTDLAAAV